MRPQLYQTKTNCVYQINIQIDSSLEQTCYSVNYLREKDSLNN